MQELVAAAIREVGRCGIGATMLIIGPSNLPTGATPAVPAPSPQGGAVTVLTDGAAKQIDALGAEVNRLGAQVLETAKQRDAANAAAGGWKAQAEATEKKLQAAQKVAAGAPSAGDTAGAAIIQELTDKLVATEAALAAAKSAPPAAVQVSGQAAAPAQAIGDYDLSVLGLSSDLIKKITKKDITTVGIAYTAAKDGTLAAKLKDAKLTKDEVITAIESLLRMGPAPGAAGAGAPTLAAAAASGVATAAGDAPAGHKDQPWSRRLVTARKKEVGRSEALAELGKRREEIVARWPKAFSMVEGQEKLGAPDDLKAEDLKAFVEAATAYYAAEGNYDLFDGQLRAVLHCLNLPFDITKYKTVDAILQSIGLVHLMESTPTTAVAAAPPPPPEAK